MMISALGKDPYYEDEIYGQLLHEALKDDDVNESEVKEETSNEEEREDSETATPKKKDSKKRKSKKSRCKRSYTVPRRSNSLENVNDTDKIFYVNDGYLNPLATAIEPGGEHRRASVQSKGAMRSKAGGSATRSCVVRFNSLSLPSDEPVICRKLVTKL